MVPLCLRYTCLTALLVLTPVAGARADGDLSLTFGVYQSDKASVMFRKFDPIVRHLAKTLEGDLARPTKIRLRIFKTYDQGIDAMVAGSVDFARFGPASYILAKGRNPGVRLLAMEERKGKHRFNGVFVVAADSPVRTLGELRGRRIAFGNANSTIGHYLARAELVKAGLKAGDLAGFAFLGRHDKVFKAVALGDFDAGALKETTFERNNKDDMLRVLHRFENVTKPWLARGGLDRGVHQALCNNLLALRDPTLLENLKVDGFAPATDADYAFVREGMEIGKRFGDAGH